MKNNNYQSKKKNIFYKYMTKTTINGIPNIITSNNKFIKFFWICFCMIAASICAFFIFESGADYLAWNVITTVQIVRENKMVFPAISVCFDNDETTLQDSLIDCSFNDNSCSHDEFEFVRLLSNLGTKKHCYIFNGGKNSSGHIIPLKQTSKTNHFSGLKLSFFENTLVYYSVNDNNVKPTYDEIFSRLKTGQERFLIIDKLSEKKLDIPYNPCQNNKVIKQTLTPEILKSIGDYEYRQNNCYSICSMNYLTLACNCTFNESINCADSNCLKVEYDAFDYTKQCSHLCPVECDSNHYTVKKQAVSYLPSGEKLIELREWLKVKNKDSDLSDRKLISKIMYMNFFYENLKYTSITQIPKMIFSDLVSNVGGTLGLFLGISLLSFIEVLEFFIEIIFISSENKYHVAALD